MFEDLFIRDEVREPCEQATSTESCPKNGHDQEILTDVPQPQGMTPLLYNRKPPQYVRQQELPWHRIALEKAAKGFTAREIADELGCSPTAVQDILRQPQYQQTQTELIKREADEDREVYEVIKTNVVSAVKTLKDIMNDKNQSAAYRIAACKELLDRRYGKPNQPMNRNTDVDLSQLSDAELTKLAFQN